MSRRRWSDTPVRAFLTDGEEPCEARNLYVIYNAEIAAFRSRSGLFSHRWTPNIREAALFTDADVADAIRRKFHAGEPDTAVHLLTLKVYPPESLFDTGGES